MAQQHLGADVAAYVDGQLSVDAVRAADAHLLTCEQCERAVRQQRLIKSRMGTGAVPTPPSHLIYSLTQLQSAAPAQRRWWHRLCQNAPVTVGLAVLGASMAVLAVAYVVGGPERFDGITPGFEDYSAEFFGATATSLAATYSRVAPEHLDAEGWPCAEVLGADMRRTSVGYDRASDVISVRYTDGSRRLQLYEQAGRLDRSALVGFRHWDLASSRVWLREGHPTVVTWDRDDITFTIVTDADLEQLATAISQLPTGDDGMSPLDRIGGGLRQMTAWAAA